jgi:carboxyl-terminal processing protease
VEALHHLEGQALDNQGEPLQGVVLDLRGNPGGLFGSAVQVAQLFLAEGVICYTHSLFQKYNQPYRAGNMNPYRLPLVVLIDGDTASAAEVLAGALKDQRRAVVIGETTFGKNTIQGLFELNRPPLDRTPGGIRITVARFYSPANHASRARAVEPNTPYDPRVEEGLLNVARRQLLMLINPMPMQPPGPMPPQM